MAPLSPVRSTARFTESRTRNVCTYLWEWGSTGLPGCWNSPYGIRLSSIRCLFCVACSIRNIAVQWCTLPSPLQGWRFFQFPPANPSQATERFCYLMKKRKWKKIAVATQRHQEIKIDETEIPCSLNRNYKICLAINGRCCTVVIVDSGSECSCNWLPTERKPEVAPSLY